VDVTRREALADISPKHSELLISLLKRVQTNFLSVEPLPTSRAVAASRR